MKDDSVSGKDRMWVFPFLQKIQVGMRRLRNPCMSFDVAVQAIFNRPCRESGEAGRDVNDFRESLSRERFEIVFLRHTIPFQALCHIWQYSKAGLASAQPQTEIYDPDSTCKRTGEKEAKPRISASWKSLKARFVERLTHSPRRNLWQWWADLQHMSSEDLAQRAESLLDLHGR